MTVLMQVMTLFVLMLCGFGAAKCKVLDDKGLRGLNQLVLTFAQPALTPEGIDYVFIGGQLALDHGEILKNNCGKSIRQ